MNLFAIIGAALAFGGIIKKNLWALGLGLVIMTLGLQAG